MYESGWCHYWEKNARLTVLWANSWTDGYRGATGNHGNHPMSLTPAALINRRRRVRQVAVREWPPKASHESHWGRDLNSASVRGWEWIITTPCLNEQTSNNNKLHSKQVTRIMRKVSDRERQKEVNLLAVFTFYEPTLWAIRRISQMSPVQCNKIRHLLTSIEKVWSAANQQHALCMFVIGFDRCISYSGISWHPGY